MCDTGEQLISHNVHYTVHIVHYTMYTALHCTVHTVFSGLMCDRGEQHDLAGGSFQSPAIYLFVACEYDDDDHERNVR